MHRGGKIPSKHMSLHLQCFSTCFIRSKMMKATVPVNTRGGKKRSGLRKGAIFKPSVAFQEQLWEIQECSKQCIANIVSYAKSECIIYRCYCKHTEERLEGLNCVSFIGGISRMLITGCLLRTAGQLLSLLDKR